MGGPRTKYGYGSRTHVGAKRQDERLDQRRQVREEAARRHHTPTPLRKPAGHARTLSCSSQGPCASRRRAWRHRRFSSSSARMQRQRPASMSSTRRRTSPRKHRWMAMAAHHGKHTRLLSGGAAAAQERKPAAARRVPRLPARSRARRCASYCLSSSHLAECSSQRSDSGATRTWQWVARGGAVIPVTTSGGTEPRRFAPVMGKPSAALVGAQRGCRWAGAGAGVGLEVGLEAGCLLLGLDVCQLDQRRRERPLRTCARAVAVSGVPLLATLMQLHSRLHEAPCVLKHSQCAEPERAARREGSRAVEAGGRTYVPQSLFVVNRLGCAAMPTAAQLPRRIRQIPPTRVCSADLCALPMLSTRYGRLGWRRCTGSEHARAVRVQRRNQSRLSGVVVCADSVEAEAAVRTVVVGRDDRVVTAVVFAEPPAATV